MLVRSRDVPTLPSAAHETARERKRQSPHAEKRRVRHPARGRSMLRPYKDTHQCEE
jgi:hypothetical protein